MTCEQFLKVVNSQYPADVTKGTLAEVERHLQTCVGCNRILEQNRLQVETETRTRTRVSVKR